MFHSYEVLDRNQMKQSGTVKVRIYEKMILINKRLGYIRQNIRQKYCIETIEGNN